MKAVKVQRYVGYVGELSHKCSESSALGYVRKIPNESFGLREMSENFLINEAMSECYLMKIREKRKFGVSWDEILP